MHKNICARIGSSNQDGLDFKAAALSQGKKAGDRTVKEETKGKEA